MKLPILSVALLATVAACATGASDSDLDPLGIYDFSTEVQGQAVAGSFRIERSEGEYRGSIMATNMPAMSILDVKVEGHWLSIFSNTGTNPLEIVLAFVGDSFTGEWLIRDASGAVEDQGPLNGRRRSGSGSSGQPGTA